MNGYKAFYADKELDVYALTSYAAHCIAVEKFKAPKSRRHLVSVMLCEKNGQAISHSTNELPGA